MHLWNFPLEGDTLYLETCFLKGNNSALLLVVSVVMSLLMFIVTESILKVLAIRKADDIVLACSGTVNFLNKITYPIFFMINQVNSFIIKIFCLEKEYDETSETNQSILGAVEMYYKKGAILNED